MESFGVVIEKGATDWQIFQQVNGFSDIHISGSWFYPAKESDELEIYITVRREDDREPVVWWSKCDMTGNTFSADLKIPAGGLYQIETCLTVNKNHNWCEWAVRGDIIYHIGVGDLYVIAGQSNSCGYGKDTVYDPSELGVHILKNDGKWHLAAHPLQDCTNGYDAKNRDDGSVGHSLYLSFAKNVKREVGYPIGLIQTAKGGTSIQEWSPDAEDSLFENMIARIQKAGGRISGIVWYQGGADTTMERCRQYQTNLLRLITAARETLKCVSLPFFIFQISKVLDPASDWDDECYAIVREAQRRLGREKNVYSLPTGDCVLSDFAHISAKSNICLGERLAKSVLAHVYGKSALCDAPDVERIVQTGQNELEIVFRNIYDKLDTFRCPANQLAIRVSDAQGENPIASYILKGRDTIAVCCERALGNETVVHGGWTKNMSGVLPIDFATHLPMLSFYEVKCT